MPERTDAQPGFFGHASAWLGTFLAHLRVRLQLAGIESKEAAVHFGIILALGIGGGIVLVFGYLFLCLALVFLAAWAFGGGNAWIAVLLAMAVLHFAGAAVLLFLAKNKLGTPVFPATLDELRKDQEWLTTNARQP